MTQFQFDAIVKIVQSGAPALANELYNALNNLVNEYNKLLKEKQELEATQPDTESDRTKSSTTEE